ncbi:MAG: homocitrate synthase [Dehalococcoidia bacterium]|nr:MAG: homocitrate synthase [Dehalococcoidia bacterium]
MAYNVQRLKGKEHFENGKWWVSPLNFEPEVVKDFRNKKVLIHDATLRDGEQTVGVAFSPEERVAIAEQLSGIGIHRIEIGMPPASPEILEGMKRIVKRNLKSEPVAFVRTIKKDIDMAIEAGVKTAILEHIMNPYATESAYGLTKEEVLDRLITTVNYANEHNLKTIFMGWDLTRGDDWDFVKDVYTKLASETKLAGLVAVDTVGCASPRAIGYLCRKLREWVPNVPLEFHTHNEFGLAVGCVMEAVANGASVIHTAFNGLGDRTGNVATEEVIMSLELLAGIKTGIKLEGIAGVSLAIENISRRVLPGNKPIVGRDLNKLETGIGADLHRKFKDAGIDVTIQAFVPEVVGQEPYHLVMGKNSGAATIEFYLDKNGLKATEDQVKEITDRVKWQGRVQHTLLTDAQFLAICRAVMGS